MVGVGEPVARVQPAWPGKQEGQRVREAESSLRRDQLLPCPCRRPARPRGEAGRGSPGSPARSEVPGWGQWPGATLVVSLNTGATGGQGQVTATLSEPGLAAWPHLAPVSQMASDRPHSPPSSLVLHKALLGVRSLPGAKLPPSGLACGPWVCDGLPGSPDGSRGAGGARTAGQGEARLPGAQPRPRAPGSCFQDPTGLRPPGHEARAPDLPARPGQTRQRAPARPWGCRRGEGRLPYLHLRRAPAKGEGTGPAGGTQAAGGGGGEGSGFSPSSSWSRCQPPARPPAASARTQGLLPFPAWKAPSLPPHPELRAWRKGPEPPAAFPLQDPPPPRGASMDACPGGEGPAAPLGRLSLAAATGGVPGPRLGRHSQDPGRTPPWEPACWHRCPGRFG